MIGILKVVLVEVAVTVGKMLLEEIKEEATKDEPKGRRKS